MGKNVVNSGLTPLLVGTPGVTKYHISVSKGTTHSPLLSGGNDVDISAEDAQALVAAAGADAQLDRGGLLFAEAMAGLDGGASFWSGLDSEEEGALVESVALTQVQMMGPA